IQTEEGSAARSQEKSSRSPRSDLPRSDESAGPAWLPRRIWQAGNAALSRLFSGRLRGRPLESKTQTKMEQAFSADFNDVRIHDDASAHAATEAINAEAFTHGDDIYLGVDASSPDSEAGRAMVAHELAHVAQQRQAGAIDADRVGQPGDAFERAAD